MKRSLKRSMGGKRKTCSKRRTGGKRRMKRSMSGKRRTGGKRRTSSAQRGGG